MSHGMRALYAMGAVLVLALELAALAKWQRQPPPGKVAFHPPPLSALPSQPQPVRAQVDDFAELRPQVRWVQTRLGRENLLTPDLQSRLLLAKSAARRAGLHEVGLGFQDVYGLINAETSWVPRTGASKDGTPNLGVAQFEPATAQALGLRDPHDAVEAVHAAAQHMREAAHWSAGRIAGLQLAPQQRADRLREGVSIYYNLSSRGRAVWDGRNTGRLPRGTQSHIRNARLGAQEAVFLEAQLAALERPLERGPSVTTAAASGNRAYVP